MKRLFKDNACQKMVAMVVGVVCGVEYWLLKYPLGYYNLFNNDSIAKSRSAMVAPGRAISSLFHEGYSTTAGITTTPGFQDDLGDMRGH